MQLTIWQKVGANQRNKYVLNSRTQTYQNGLHQNNFIWSA